MKYTEVRAVITKIDSVARWYKKTDDHYGIYDKVMQLTDNDHEIADDAACWCEIAPIGARYEFREGYIDIEEV